MQDQQTGWSPGMLGGHRIGRTAQANNAAPQPGLKRCQAAHESDLHIAYAGHNNFLPRQLETHQGHDDAASSAAISPHSAKNAFQRLIEMAFDIVPGCMGSALGELSMAQAVNDPCQSVALPLPNDKGVAVFWRRSIRASGSAEFEQARK